MTHLSAGTAGGPDITGLGSRLREHRARAGLTLEAAAQRLGLSPAHLSRLETGNRQPSLPVLLVLARTYGSTVGELLGEDTDHDPVIRTSRTKAVTAGGWTYRQAGGPARAMQALRLHIPYPEQGTDPASRTQDMQPGLVRVHPGEEWLYVLAGRLRLGLGERTHILGPGDAAHYDSLTPHRIAAATPEGADLLFVHTLLQSTPSSLCVGGPPPHIAG